jgi:hypothetical protein
MGSNKLGLEFYVRRSIAHGHLGLKLEPWLLIPVVIRRMDEVAVEQGDAAGFVVKFDDISTSVHGYEHSTEIVRFYQCSPKGPEDAR